LLVRESQAEAKKPQSYGDAAGHRALREAIARHIGVSRGVQASVDDITITNGAQQAPDVVARALLEHGDRVAVEDPGYLPPRLLFQSLGAQVRGVPVDQEGIMVDALPRQTRLVYVTPSHQYPIGITMSLSRRLALLEWAARNDAAVVEDDYDTEFRFDGRPVESLQALDVSGRVIYAGSFSKSLLPSLRLGFVVTPHCCTSAVHKAKYVSDWHSPMVTQGALARFIDDGGFARHVRKLNRLYTERRDLILTILARDFANYLTVIPSVAGLHITTLSRSASVKKISSIVANATALGVRVQELSSFAIDSPPRRHSPRL
jgi:GntR family transcriptional regulator/MocR family aminotransferase